MFIKRAKFKIVEVNPTVESISARISKIASKLSDVLTDTEYVKILGTKTDDDLFFLTRAMTAETDEPRPNQNGDRFPAEELRKSYKTFIGKNLFLNHDADDVSKAVGKIAGAWYIDEDKKDEHIVCLCRVSRKCEPKLAMQIETGILGEVSMGCGCEICVCGICGCECKSANDFCDHLKHLGHMITSDAGERIQATSINKGITFNELSIVSSPADESARMISVYASEESKGIEKKAGNNEINIDIEDEQQRSTWQEKEDARVADIIIKDSNKYYLQPDFLKPFETDSWTKEQKQQLLNLSNEEQIEFLAQVLKNWSFETADMQIVDQQSKELFYKKLEELNYKNLYMSSPENGYVFKSASIKDTEKKAENKKTCAFPEDLEGALKEMTTEEFIIAMSKSDFYDMRDNADDEDETSIQLMKERVNTVKEEDIKSAYEQAIDGEDKAEFTTYEQFKKHYEDAVDSLLNTRTSAKKPKENLYKKYKDKQDSYWEALGEFENNTLEEGMSKTDIENELSSLAEDYNLDKAFLVQFFYDEHPEFKSKKASKQNKWVRKTSAKEEEKTDMKNEKENKEEVIKEEKKPSQPVIDLIKSYLEKSGLSGEELEKELQDKFKVHYNLEVSVKDYIEGLDELKNAISEKKDTKDIVDDLAVDTEILGIQYNEEVGNKKKAFRVDPYAYVIEFDTKEGYDKAKEYFTKTPADFEITFDMPSDFILEVSPIRTMEKEEFTNFVLGLGLDKEAYKMNEKKADHEMATGTVVPLKLSNQITDKLGIEATEVQKYFLDWRLEKNLDKIPSDVIKMFNEYYDAYYSNKQADNAENKGGETEEHKTPETTLKDIKEDFKKLQDMVAKGEDIAVMIKDLEEDVVILKEQTENKKLKEEVKDTTKEAVKKKAGTWALPDTKEKAEQLQKLMESPIEADSEVYNKLYDIYGDDKLFDEIDQAMEKGDIEDIRNIIKVELGESIKNIDSWKNKPDAQTIDILKQIVGAEAESSVKTADNTIRRNDTVEYEGSKYIVTDINGDEIIIEQEDFPYEEKTVKKDVLVKLASRQSKISAITPPPQPDNASLTQGMKWVFNSTTNAWEQKPTTDTNTVEVSTTASENGQNFVPSYSISVTDIANDDAVLECIEDVHSLDMAFRKAQELQDKYKDRDNFAVNIFGFKTEKACKDGVCDYAKAYYVKYNGKEASVENIKRVVANGKVMLLDGMKIIATKKLHKLAEEDKPRFYINDMVKFIDATGDEETERVGEIVDELPVYQGIHNYIVELDNGDKFELSEDELTLKNQNKTASAFDKMDRIDITDGYYAVKNEDGDIVIKNKENKTVDTYVDAFGDDVALIMAFFTEIYGKKDKKDDKGLENKVKETEEKLDSETPKDDKQSETKQSCNCDKCANEEKPADEKALEEIANDKKADEDSDNFGTDTEAEKPQTEDTVQDTEKEITDESVIADQLDKVVVVNDFVKETDANKFVVSFVMMVNNELITQNKEFENKEEAEDFKTKLVEKAKSKVKDNSIAEDKANLEKEKAEVESQRKEVNAEKIRLELMKKSDFARKLAREAYEKGAIYYSNSDFEEAVNVKMLHPIEACKVLEANTIKLQAKKIMAMSDIEIKGFQTVVNSFKKEASAPKTDLTLKTAFLNGDKGSKIFDDFEKELSRDEDSVDTFWAKLDEKSPKK